MAQEITWQPDFTPEEYRDAEKKLFDKVNPKVREVSLHHAREKRPEANFIVMAVACEVDDLITLQATRTSGCGILSESLVWAMAYQWSRYWCDWIEREGLDG